MLCIEQQRVRPMPRRPEIEIAGDYHIVNRRVDKRVIYKDEEDFRHFSDK